MIDNESSIKAERCKDPGVCHTPHSTVDRVLMLFICMDYLVPRRRGRAVGENVI